MSIKIVDAIIYHCKLALGTSLTGHIEYCKPDSSSTIKINGVEYKFERIKYYAIYDGDGNLINIDGQFYYNEKTYTIKVTPDDEASDWFNSRIGSAPSRRYKNEYIIL